MSKILIVGSGSLPILMEDLLKAYGFEVERKENLEDKILGLEYTCVVLDDLKIYSLENSSGDE